MTTDTTLATLSAAPILPITTPHEHEIAMRNLRYIAAETARAEEHRKAEVAPLQVQIDEINSRFKPAIEEMQKRRRIIEALIADYEADNAEMVAESLPMTDRWSAEITSLAELVDAASRNPKLLVYVEPSVTMLNKQARLLKGLMRIPGVRAVNKPTPTVRQKKGENLIE